MDVYWLEQNEANIPRDVQWLSASEQERLEALRVPKRRADWRLGRWTAKLAAAAYLDLPNSPGSLAKIELRPAPSGAPDLFFANQPAAIAVSLSHRDGVAICALAPAEHSLGCDLEAIEPRSEAFVEDSFTTEEREFISTITPAERPQICALLWSAKESALKALRTGLRVDTRSLRVLPAVALKRNDGHWSIDGLDNQPSHRFGSWRPLRVRLAGGQIFHGWFQIAGNFVHTVISSPRSRQPVPLHLEISIP